MEVEKAQVVEILRARGDQDLADRVNRELPTRFDPDDVEMLRGLDLAVDSGDARRHAQGGLGEAMADLPQAGRDDERS